MAEDWWVISVVGLESSTSLKKNFFSNNIDSGGPNALYDVDFSVRLQLNLIVAATPADSGKFKAFNGTEITEHPW